MCPEVNTAFTPLSYMLPMCNALIERQYYISSGSLNLNHQQFCPRMNRLRAVFLFHKSFIIPSVILTIFLGLYSWFINDEFAIQSFGFGYMVTPLFMQFFKFEFRNKGLYYFYFNLGISRIDLWVSNIVFSLTGGLVISIITWIIYLSIAS